MRPSYETATALALCDFVEKGSVYRGKKPIHWCLSCKTALAEAEVEYADETSPSVFVRFPLPDPKIRDVFPMAAPWRRSIRQTDGQHLRAHLGQKGHDHAAVQLDGVHEI